MGQMKSLLLYFDGLALLLPEDHFCATVAQEAELAQPLQQAGLLHNFAPGTWLDTDTARTIQQAAAHSRRAGGPAFISMGHLAATETISTAHLVAELASAHLVVEQMLRSGTVIRRRPDLGPDMVDMPERVRAAVLLTVGLAAQTKVSDHRIHLVGDLSQATRARSGKAERTAQILHQDILNVGIDLSQVPLNEILDYRREHGASYKAYAQDLRQFVRGLEAAEPIDRPRMLHERSESIADHASQLRRARRAWGRPVTALAFAGAGAAWTLHQADVWGAVFAALGAAAGFSRPARPESPFSYLLETQRIS
ncbi:hypothetical protein ACFQ10_54685 [Streptomyces indonesiensis]